MPTTKFLTDRKRGEPAQKYVAGMLRNWGLTVREIPKGYRPGFDMNMQGRLYGYDIDTTVEVKYDYMSEIPRALARRRRAGLNHRRARHDHCQHRRRQPEGRNVCEDAAPQVLINILPKCEVSNSKNKR
jgi:hypothetical protein